MALPIFQPDSTEIGDPSTDVPSRYSKAERLVVDYGSGHRESAMIEVARLRFALLPGNADRAGYACLPIAKLIEVRNDRQLVLDEDFLPPVLDCHASQTLSDRLSEVQGMLRHRGEALAGRLAQSGTRGVAEIADYLLLQAINRYEPLFDHFSNLSMLHPEDLYRTLVELAGELSTYARPDKRPTPMGVYKHDDSSEAFAAVMLSLRESLRTVLEQTAVQVALRQHRYGVQVADVGDRKIFTESSFVLAVRADVEAERLRRGFPSHIKIGPASKIKELVNVALPGIAISALPVAPRQIPFHVGVTYFEIDRKSNYWKEISQSGALALHVAGDFPNLDMALWAIKGQ
ncbi:type VI secretion system baseplate subunit TssK [Ensifer adhaerens]